MLAITNRHASERLSMSIKPARKLDRERLGHFANSDARLNSKSACFDEVRLVS
jgi:hypothetical protein